MNLSDLVKALDVVAVVFMAAPLYNLIVVNERVQFGKAPLEVDQYFENIALEFAMDGCKRNHWSGP